MAPREPAVAPWGVEICVCIPGTSLCNLRVYFFVCTFLQDILLPPLGQPKLSTFAIDGLALCLTVCDKVY